jgi:hypothetical protein
MSKDVLFTEFGPSDTVYCSTLVPSSLYSNGGNLENIKPCPAGQSNKNKINLRYQINLCYVLR